MLRSSHCKNVYLEQVCLNGTTIKKKWQESLRDDEFKGRASTSATDESKEIIEKCLRKI
jgi:hypothetical protein